MINYEILVKKLLVQQFPQYFGLSIKPVEIQGHDNRTFRLGDDMLIRLPSSEIYAAKVLKEQKWLPFLAKYISLKIPRPIAIGKPCNIYPWHFSIYEFIDGNSANELEIDDLALEKIAFDLANFLKELQAINIDDAPAPGRHNFFRGGNLKIYEEEARLAISNLKDFIDVKSATSLLNKALESSWNKNPIWIHGDLAAGNIIIKNQKLVGIIDFSGIAVGDPACDLTIAWTLFKNESRKIFHQNLDLDDNTWNRARGWALWKAAIELVSGLDNKDFTKVKEWKKIIDEIQLIS